MFRHQIDQTLKKVSSSLRLEVAAAVDPVEDQVARAEEWAAERPEAPAAGRVGEWAAQVERAVEDRARDPGPQAWEAAGRLAQAQEAGVPASPIREWEAAAQEAQVPVWGPEKQDRSRAANRAVGLKPNKRSSYRAPASPSAHLL